MDAIASTAHALMDGHGLLERGWTFAFDRAKMRAGLCDSSRKRITLSRHLVNAADDAVRNVLLHEVAHALVGSEHGHDDVWRAKALEIGCDGTRCYLGGPLADPRWRVLCPCGTVDERRHALRRTLKDAACRLCAGKVLAIDTRLHGPWRYRCPCGGLDFHGTTLDARNFGVRCPECLCTVAASPT
jgi:hypothetical protein